MFSLIIHITMNTTDRIGHVCISTEIEKTINFEAVGGPMISASLMANNKQHVSITPNDDIFTHCSCLSDNVRNKANVMSYRIIMGDR